MAAAASSKLYVSPGRTRRKKTAVGQKHAQPFPPTTARDFWQPKMVDYAFGRESFRVTAFRKQRPNISLDSLVEQITWQRQGAAPRTGTLDFYRPLGYHHANTISQNDQVGIDVSLTGPNGPWYRFLRLAVNQPQESVVAATTSLDLVTVNIAQLTQSKSTFHYGKDKTHPKGWTATQVTVDVARRFNAPLGKIPTSTALIPTIAEKSSSAYDVILKAWQEDRHITGRRFVIDDDDGKVNIVEMGKPRYMLPLGPALAEAVISSFGGTKYANAVEVNGTKVKITTSTDSHGKHVTKHRSKSSLAVTVVDDAGVKRYGYIQKVIKAPAKLNSTGELREYGRQYLARNAKPHPSVEITHPGIPWVDVGDAILLVIPEIDFRNLVYVQTAVHSVGAGQYTMDVTIAYGDPWLESQSGKISAAKRARGLHLKDGSHFLSTSARPHVAAAVKHAK